MNLTKVEETTTVLHLSVPPPSAFADIRVARNVTRLNELNQQRRQQQQQLEQQQLEQHAVDVENGKSADVGELTVVQDLSETPAGDLKMEDVDEMTASCPPSYDMTPSPAAGDTTSVPDTGANGPASEKTAGKDRFQRAAIRVKNVLKRKTLLQKALTKVRERRKQNEEAEKGRKHKKKKEKKHQPSSAVRAGDGNASMDGAVSSLEMESIPAPVEGSTKRRSSSVLELIDYEESTA